MRSKWYGSLNQARARRTAMRLAASRLKNHTPGSFPSRCTYVRTFVSWKLDSGGNGGSTPGRTPCMVKGTSPTNARPS